MKKATILFAAILTVLTIHTTGACASERWTKAQAQVWGEANPWFCGFNYIPANAVNYTAMWDKDEFFARSDGARTRACRRDGA